MALNEITDKLFVFPYLQLDVDFHLGCQIGKGWCGWLSKDMTVMGQSKTSTGTLSSEISWLKIKFPAVLVSRNKPNWTRKATPPHGLELMSNDKRGADYTMLTDVSVMSS